MMQRNNEIARAMKAAAVALGADAREIEAACANLALASRLDAGLYPGSQVIPFERPRHARHLRSVANRTPLDCA